MTDKQTVFVDVYKRPTGKFERTEIKHVYPKDAAFFNQFDIKLSMESDGEDGYIVYGDYGALTLDDEPDEVIVFSQGRNCWDTLADLRSQLEKRMKDAYT